jgi:flavin reductase (DIM6/NTAB) family NADH-FMN oxidoreductase RutF
MAVKYLPPLLQDQVKTDNDQSRWPCFFPSSLGMITSWADKKTPNLMPCGSTIIVSRHPLTVGICVAYSAINERYAPRSSLGFIRKNRAFTCGVAFIDDAIVEAVHYAGTTSFSEDACKLANTGLTFESGEQAPYLPALPVHFECMLVGEHPMGTHVLFLGEVTRIIIRKDVTPNNPFRWRPWADVVASAP